MKMSNEVRKNFINWGADARMAVLGVTVDVISNEQLKFMVDYILYLLKEEQNVAHDLDSAETILEAVNKYNSNNVPVSHLTVNFTEFGILLTFVRDEEMKTLTQESGVLSYVYNLTHPECSELGYTYFRDEDSLVRRIA